MGVKLGHIEKHRRVQYNSVMRKIFGPNRGEVAGEWTTLPNERLCALCSLLNIIRVIKSTRLRSGVGGCGTYGGVEMCVQGSDGLT
jgi:hypothetical protein